MTPHEFEMAVVRDRPGMIRYAMKRLQDEQAAEDVVQVTLCELDRNRRRFVVAGRAGTRRASVTSWFIRCLELRIKDVIRRRMREPEAVSVERIYADELTHSDGLARPPHGLSETTNELLDDVREAVSLLPDDLRRVCDLVHLQGYTQ